MSDQPDRSHLKNDPVAPAREKPAGPQELPLEASIPLAPDMSLGDGRHPAGHTVVALTKSDSATRARALQRLQQQQGNTYVKGLMSGLPGGALAPRPSSPMPGAEPSSTEALAAMGAFAASPLAVSRRTASGPHLQRDPRRPPRRPAARGTPLEVAAATFDEAGRTMAAFLTGYTRPARLIVTDGVAARVYDGNGAPLSPLHFRFRNPSAVPSGVFTKTSDDPSGRLHALIRMPNGALLPERQAVRFRGTSVDFNTVFENQSEFNNALRGGVSFYVIPSGTPSAVTQPPPPPPQQVPEFLRPTGARATANMPAYGARLQVLSPMVTSTNSTGNFLMHVEKAVGQGIVDMTTNVMQPMAFRWETIRIDANNQTTEIGRLAGLAEAYRRRMRNLAADLETARGEHPEEQNFIERGVRDYNALMMTGIRVPLALAGETVHQFIKMLFWGADPFTEDMIEIPWRTPGLYLVRGSATPITPPDAAVRRATSVVGAIIHVQDIAQLAREGLPAPEAQTRALQERLTAYERRRQALLRRENSIGLAAEEMDELEEVGLRIEYLRARIAAAADPRANLRADIADLERRIAALTGPGAPTGEGATAQLAALRGEQQRLQGIMTRADTRLGVAAGTAVMMTGVLVDEATGLRRGLTFSIAEDHYVNTGNVQVRIADVSDERGGNFSATRGNRADAWKGAMRDMRRNLGRGRAWLSYRPPAPYDRIDLDLPNPMQLQIAEADQAREMVQDIVNVGTLAVLIAAPFTGGASLSLLVPLGIAGAAVSLYRLVDRAIYNRLELDAEAVSDMINLASLGIGRLGQAGPFATRLQLVFSEGRVAAKLLEGGGYVVMTYQTWQVLTAPDDPSDPAGSRARKVEAILQFLQAGGVASASRIRGSVRERVLGEEPTAAGGTTPEGVPPTPAAPRERTGGAGGPPAGVPRAGAPETPAPVRPTTRAGGRATTEEPGVPRVGSGEPGVPVAAPQAQARVPGTGATHAEVQAFLDNPATTLREVQQYWFRLGNWAEGLRWVARRVSPAGQGRLQAARQELFDAALAHVRRTIPEAECQVSMPGSVGSASDMDPTFLGPRTLEATRLFREGMELALRQRGLPTAGWMDVLGVNPYTDPQAARYAIAGTEPAAAQARSRLDLQEYIQLQLQHRARLMAEDPTGASWQRFVSEQVAAGARIDPQSGARLQSEFAAIDRQARQFDADLLRSAAALDPELARLPPDQALTTLRSPAGRDRLRQARARLLAEHQARLAQMQAEAGDNPSLQQREAIQAETMRMKFYEEEAYHPSAIESVVEGQQRGHQARVESGQPAQPLPELPAVRRQNAMIDSLNMLDEHVPQVVQALREGVSPNDALGPVAKYLARALLEAREMGVPIGNRNRLLAALSRRLRARVGPAVGAGGTPEARRGATMSDAEAQAIVNATDAWGLTTRGQVHADAFLREITDLMGRLRTSVSLRRAIGTEAAEAMRPEAGHPWRGAGASEPTTTPQSRQPVPAPPTPAEE